MRRWHNVKQNSEDWYKLRIGKITSSNFGKICANFGKKFGDPAIRYARKKALEIVTGKLDESENYSNSYMDRGHELEPIAIELYEYETMYNVTNGGFTEWGIFGDSPDGMVGVDGCVEVKSVIPSTHWERIEKGGYDTAYYWQIQGHLLVSDKKWCDFISYCPEFVEGKQLYIHRVYRNDLMLSQLSERLSEFEDLVYRKVEILLK